MRRLAIFFLFIITIMALIIPNNSQATCATYIKVYYIYQTATTAYIYGTGYNYNTSPSTYAFWYTTTNQAFVRMAVASLTSNSYVRVIGNATVCPASGTLRAGGAISSIYLLKNG